ncbi:MAG: stage II sporulation protein P, partial [Bacillota bacterium]
MFTGTTLLLLAVAALIYLGAAQQVLDRMRLSRTTALVLTAAMAAGTFLPEVRLAPGIGVDPGGALVPAGVAIYLLVTADRAAERRRALVATLWTAALVIATDWLLPSDPHGGRLFVLDPVWLPMAIAAFFGYLAGRSRRSAFIAATLGLVLVDLVTVAANAVRGIPGALVSIGGGGLLDGVVLAGVGAVVLAELFGETREWLARRAARRARHQR